MKLLVHSHTHHLMRDLCSVYIANAMIINSVILLSLHVQAYYLTLHRITSPLIHYGMIIGTSKRDAVKQKRGRVSKSSCPRNFVSERDSREFLFRRLIFNFLVERRDYAIIR